MNSHRHIESLNNLSWYESIFDQHRLFLGNLKLNPTCADLKKDVEIIDNGICVSAFGYTAEAIPRAVKYNNNFFIEYIFFISNGELKEEVWRFYLDETCVLGSPEGQTHICDIQNKYIAKHICGRVLLGILNSSLISPTCIPEK